MRRLTKLQQTTSFEVLISWLNGEPLTTLDEVNPKPITTTATPAERARICRLIANLQAMQTFLDSVYDPTSIRHRRRLNELEYGTWKCIQRYEMLPVFVADRDDPRRGISLR